MFAADDLGEYQYGILIKLIDVIAGHFFKIEFAQFETNVQ